MKIRTILPAVLFILTGCVLFAQYPKDETIMPYPKPVKERTLRQRFVCDTTGPPTWKALHHSLLNPLNDSLKIESNGGDPYVLLPAVEKPHTGTFEFRIKMKNKMEPGAEIFWATQKQPGFLPENAARFNFLNDGEWHTYKTEFTTDAPLTNIRFDPGTSPGIAEVAWVELYEVVYSDEPLKRPDGIDPYWIANVENWKTISSDNIKIKFDENGRGAVVFVDEKAVGEIYPLMYVDLNLPLGGCTSIPLVDDTPASSESSGSDKYSGALPLSFATGSKTSIVFSGPFQGKLSFELKGSELRFQMKSSENFFGPVFRPYGEMEQAILSGVEYLEKGEHSSSTADIETKEHLRFAPNAMDVTWPFMAVVTEKVGFGLLWDNPKVQSVFATPDFIFGEPTKHHMGLYGKELSGTVKITSKKHPLPPEVTQLDNLILWAFQKHGLPELPQRPRDDEQQRLLNLAGFEKSIGAGPDGTGWRHAAIPGVEKQSFPLLYGSDFVTAIWQLTGKVPNVPKLDNGGAHLQNPASFFLTGRGEDFRNWKKNESKLYRSWQRPDGSFPYAGKYLRGHWEDTASGHCGNTLYRLLYTYQILGEPEALDAALKGLEFANKYSVPRGAQVWELSLHTPDIMGASRMCMANVWAYEATGDKKYLNAAKVWAVRGLPFVYLWENKPGEVMRYATTPVLGATNWVAPNWIGLPVQWCGLDYSEALFMLSKHDTIVDWKKIAEGILVTGEQMQYPDGPSIGLLPDSFKLAIQKRVPADINPTVLVMQRRLLDGKLESLAVVVSPDKKFRVVSPYPTKLETTADGKPVAVIDAPSGTTYQVLVNGTEVRTIESKGTDRVE